MAYALRIWKGSGNRARCRKCHEPIVWLIDDRGKHRPFRTDATPLRTEPKDEQGRVFEIYEREACHRCQAKQQAAPAAVQESLL